MTTTEIYSLGLEGVIAGETAISTVVDGLRYRGYAVTELAEKTTFDEVAYLLLHGELPSAAQRRQRAVSFRGGCERFVPAVQSAQSRAPAGTDPRRHRGASSREQGNA